MAKKARTRGPRPIAKQIEELKHRLTKGQIAESEKLANDPGQQNIIKLAYCFLRQRSVTLTPREVREYNRIGKILGKEAAEKWKASVLIEKSKK